MNVVLLKKMSEIIDPMCFLCREHERSEVAHGVRIGSKRKISWRLATDTCSMR